MDSLFEQAVVERLQGAERTCPMGLKDLNQTAWDMRNSMEYQYVL